MGIKPYLGVIALAVCAFLLPPILITAKSAFYLTQLTMSAYYALASLGLCALMGYAGQISLGQAGFFAIGGYASSFIATRNFQAISSSPLVSVLNLTGLLTKGTDPYGEALLSLSPWVSFLFAVLLAAGVAALIGKPVLKLKGHYLAMATLGFGLVIEKIVRGTQALGAADGLSNVPPFPILPGLAIAGGKAARASNFTMSWVILALALLALVNLFRSRAGRALRALHDGEEAAAAMGVDTSRYKLNVFILGAVYAAIAGVLLTHYNGSIGPGEANVMKSVRYVAIVAVGGMANLTGTLIAGLLLNFLSLRGIFGSFDDAVFGIVLILVMLFAPGSRVLLRSIAASIRAKGKRP
jgi:branched-chain amino acid transport system permease protein